MGWIEIGDCEFAFWRTSRGLVKGAKVVVLLLIFSPLFLAGVGITWLFIPLSAPGHQWLIGTLAGAFAAYWILFFLKGIVIGLRKKGAYAWIALFLFCVAFACALPGMIIFPFIQYFTGHHRLISYLVDGCFCYYIYGQYNFLNSRLPLFKYRPVVVQTT
ncbi:MAG: hypothetical protein P4L51_23810 [Puia sp.]|nr:hypothetical protein [Puia sp.]